MNTQFAACDAHQSGQRFLDSSAPRLKRHVAPCETADGGSVPLSAGKDEKLSRVAGQSPAVSARAARLSSSLDEVQVNRDKPKGWKRHCGRFTVRGASSTIAGKTRYCRVGCKCWDCAGCAPRKAAAYCIRIAQTAEKLKLNKLLTLTLDPAKLKGAESTRYINEVFADFRVYLRRKLGYSPAYIRVLEYQKNGNAHLHILVNCYLPQDWVSEAWAAVGGGRIVDIKRVDLHRVSRYLSKYLTKQMILCAPRRARRVTTSRCIQLFAKQPSDFEWRLIKVPILRLFDLHRSKATSIHPDADGYLVSFETFELEFDLRFSPHDAR